MGGGGIDSGDTISLPPCIHPEFKYGGGGGGLPPCIHPEFKYWGGGGGERESIKKKHRNFNFRTETVIIFLCPNY